MADPIITPAWGFPIFEDGQFGLTPTSEMHEWMLSVTAAANASQPAIGSGSPEGAVVADAGRWYVDTDLDTIWFKKSGSGDTGWQLTI